MAERGEDVRRENQGRLVEGEPLEEVVEPGEGVRAVDQEERVRGRLVEAGDRTSRKSKCYLILAFLLILISFLSLIMNIGITFNRNRRVDGAIGGFVSVVSCYASLALFTYLNGRAGRGAVRPRGDHVSRQVGQTGPTGTGESRSGQVPAINVGNPSASLPVHLPDPAVAGPSGIQTPVRPVSGEHSYRTLRSGKTIFGSESRRSESQSVQASVSGESPATHRTSEVALSQSQTPPGGVSRRKINFPSRKGHILLIHSYGDSGDSDDSTSD